MSDKAEKLLKRLIRLGVFLIFFTPLVQGQFGLSFSEWPKTVFFRILVEIIFILYLILVLKKSDYLPRLSPIFLAVLIFISFLGIGTIFSVNPGRSFWGDLERCGGFVTYLHFFVFFLVLSGIFKEKKEWISFLKVIVFVSLLSSFAAIFQKIGVYSFYGNSLPERVSGTLSNPDFFGAYLVLNIFIGAFLFFFEEKNIRRLLFGSITVFNCIVLLLSGTRAAWFGLMAGFIFFVFFWFAKYSKIPPRVKKIFLVAGLVLLVAFISLAVSYQEKISYGGNIFIGRVASAFSFSSFQPRLVGWQIAEKTWRESPFFGRGLETMSYYSDKYLGSEYYRYVPETIIFDRAHNFIFDTLASVGLFGLIAFLSIFFFIFSFLSRKDRVFGKLPSLAVISFFVAYLCQSLFSFDTATTFLLLFFMLAFVNNNYEQKIVRYPGLGGEGGKKGFIVLLILISLVNIYEVNIKPAMACRYFIGALDIFSKDLPGSLEKFRKSFDLAGPYEKEIKMATAQYLISIPTEKSAVALRKEINSFISSLVFSLEKETEKPDAKYLMLHEIIIKTNEKIFLSYQDKSALEKMETATKQAIEFNSQVPKFWRYLGEIEVLKGNYDEGERDFQKAFGLNVGDVKSEIILLQNMGVICYQTGQKDKAAEYLNRAANLIIISTKFNETGLSPADVSFISNVAFVYVYDLNSPDKAVKLYETVIRYYPEYQTVLKEKIGQIRSNLPLK